MAVMWLVARYVDRQKRDLMQYLSDNGACDAEHAIDLSDDDVKASILRAMISRNVVRRTPSGKYFLDPSRVHEAYGASNHFIAYAMGAFILAIVLIIIL